MDIDQCLKHLGITQKELARRCGLNPSQISCWRSGKNSPTGTNLKKLIRGSGGIITANAVLHVKDKSSRAA